MIAAIRIVLILCSTVACYHRPASGLNYNLPVLNPQDQPCVKRVTLNGCDRQKPPKCRSASVVYHFGCEELEVKK